MRSTFASRDDVAATSADVVAISARSIDGIQPAGKPKNEGAACSTAPCRIDCDVQLSPCTSPRTEPELDRASPRAPAAVPRACAARASHAPPGRAELAAGDLRPDPLLHRLDLADPGSERLGGVRETLAERPVVASLPPAADPLRWRTRAEKLREARDDVPHECTLDHPTPFVRLRGIPRVGLSNCLRERSACACKAFGPVVRAPPARRARRPRAARRLPLRQRSPAPARASSHRR